MRVLSGGVLRKNAGAGTTIVTDVKNSGTVEALSGVVSIILTPNYAGGALVGGRWVVGATLRIAGADIATNGADLTLRGATSALQDENGADALANLAANARGSALTLEGGRNLTVPGPFTNRGVLTIGLMTDTLRAYFESQVPGVLNSVAASAASTRDELIAELANHPLFESARRYRERDLAGYDPPLLRNFLSTRRVLRANSVSPSTRSTRVTVRVSAGCEVLR